MIKKRQRTDGMKIEEVCRNTHTRKRTRKSLTKRVSVAILAKAILAQAISCPIVRCVFAASRAFLVLSCPSVYNPVLLFPPLLIAMLMMGSVCLSLPCLVPPDGSGPDLDGMGHRSIDAQFKDLRDILLPPARGFADFDKHVKTISEAVGVVTSRITSVEQTVNALVAKVALLEQTVNTLTENVSSLTARECQIEANATSVSSGSGSARSWNILGHSDGFTATGSLGSHGPGSSDDNRSTRRRLDTFSSPEDEHARSVVLQRFPFERCREGVSAWINNFWATTNVPALSKPTRIHCKTGSLSARLVFETRAKCQDFVARKKDDGIPIRS